MVNRRMGKKQYNWNNMPWEKTMFIPRTSGYPWKNWRMHRIQSSRWISETREYCKIYMPKGMGKITDAGYDALACMYAKINPLYDFTVEADITVNQFLHEPGPNNQEGFGLFLRETIKKHPVFGLYYSNMAAVGGYYGRFNFFGRSGIVNDDITRVKNFFVYRRVNRPGGVFEHDPLHYMVTENRKRRFHLLLCRLGRVLSAQMTDLDGIDILDPDENGGDCELSCLTIPAIKQGTYQIELSNAFNSHHRKPFYIGFFSARGSEIEIDKESFCLTILGKEKRFPLLGEVRAPKREVNLFPQKPFNAEDYSVELNRIFYVSPEGKPNGDGSEDKPLDIYTAIERCGFNEQIVLKPGRYILSRSIVIGKKHSGAPGRIKKLTGASAESTVIDFGGSSNMLSILGDYWIVENIHVTGGYGIQIEGSYNWLRACYSSNNFETGILIRHHDNTSAWSEWPCYNLIEKCLSYENCDVSECNSDGFGCKVASGVGNVFKECVAFLNTDDGFDFFTKNRVIGGVTAENCKSYLNGFKLDSHNKLLKTNGNGNGFKLGGSGMRVEHVVIHCDAKGNRQYGFTNNTNPYMSLVECSASNNMKKNINYEVLAGTRIRKQFSTKRCVTHNDTDFQLDTLVDEISGYYR